MLHLSDVRKELRRVAKGAISDSSLKDSVLSTRDLNAIFEEWSRDHSYEISDLDDEDFRYLSEQIHQELLEQGEIYEAANWKSYESVVRDRRMISVQELMMSNDIGYARSEGRELLIEDTEFPIDRDGYYLEPSFAGEGSQDYGDQDE